MSILIYRRIDFLIDEIDRLSQISNTDSRVISSLLEEIKILYSSLEETEYVYDEAVNEVC